VAEAAPGGGAASVTHARVLRIAWPVVLSNATVPILGAVDTGVVGQMGEAAPIGAVALGAVVLTSVYWMFGFLRMGTTGLVAQALGRGDEAEVSALLLRATMIAGAAGAVLIAAQPLLIGGALGLSPASDEVTGMAQGYVAIRVWSAPAAIAVYGITGWLIAQERTRAVLAVQVAMNAINVALDLWFVLGLGWGVEGVAVATFLAEWSGAALGLWFCRDALRGPGRGGRAALMDRRAWGRMMGVNRDILIRSALLQATFLSFVFWVSAGMGDVTLAANQVLLQFLYVTAYALDGFAFAVEALVGRFYGRGDLAGLRRAVALCSGWGVATVIVLAAGFAGLGPWVVDAMTTSPEVREAARAYLPWMVAAPLIGVAAWMLDGVFIGAARAADMRNMMAVSFVVYVGAVSVLVPAMGNHGLWAALMVSFVARGATLALRYPALERGVTADAAAPRIPREG
jgi:MATE family multidrug resistance protein